VLQQLPEATVENVETDEKRIKAQITLAVKTETCKAQATLKQQGP